MVYSTICPDCGNANNAMSIVNVEIGGTNLKAVRCNNCGKILYVFKDYGKELEEINEKMSDLDRRLDEIERGW
jgi:predicted NBD/HSP70 family sugar kinase